MSRKSILLMGLTDPLNRQFSAALSGHDFAIHIQPVDNSVIDGPPFPDLVLLGLHTSGIEILKHLREWYNSPVLVLSNDDKEEQIIEALNSGANDYIQIPVRMPETLARIRAALRDKKPVNLAHAHFGSLSIDFLNRLVRLNNQFVKFSPIEYQLLVLLVRSENCVVTAQFLVEEVWGAEQPAAIKDLRVHIMHLRKKIETDPKNPKIIVTEPKIGYKFISNPELQLYNERS